MNFTKLTCPFPRVCTEIKTHWHCMNDGEEDRCSDEDKCAACIEEFEKEND